ncbi:MAG: SGNH/GDSL hydrolase family protein [Armatimonadetes bacterium]|nr:SGNH/GDSL hydrolase family protein [Armatimonadota bacterium]
MRTLGTCAVVLLAVPLASCGAPNLAANPGFESADEHGALAGWVGESAGMTTVSFARDAEVARSGSASGRITITPTDNLSWPAFALRVPVKAGQCYAAEAWIRTRDVAKVAYIAVDYLDAKDARVSFSASGLVSGTKDWTRVAAKPVIPTGAETMVLRLILYGYGTAWFDDITLARDEAAERLAAELEKPLPTDMLARAILSEGDPAPLHRLMQAAAKGGSYTVGIIGGSITQGASASGMDKHYSAYVLRWLREHFAAAEFTFVNAGIGATGSDYGSLRCQRDLLAKGPDLVVVEYAVNDGDSLEFAETYEGLIRQILSSPKHPAVVTIYMMNEAGGNAQATKSQVDAHYHLPRVSYRDLLWPEIEAKRLAWTDISPDSVHPNDTGHHYAGKLLAAVLDRALAGLPKEPVPAPAAALPPPLHTDAYQFTALYEADDLKPAANHGWTYDPAGGWDRCLKSAVPGSVVEFDMAGDRLLLSYWRIHGAMGQAKVTVDGGPPTVLEGWFEQTWGGYRQMVKLPANGGGTHRVRVELLAEKSPESTGNEFRILCLAAAGVRR